MSHVYGIHTPQHATGCLHITGCLQAVNGPADASRNSAASSTAATWQVFQPTQHRTTNTPTLKFVVGVACCLCWCADVLEQEETAAG